MIVTLAFGEVRVEGITAPSDSALTDKLQEMRKVGEMLGSDWNNTIIQADRATSFGEVWRAMNAAKRAGYTRFQLEVETLRVPSDLPGSRD